MTKMLRTTASLILLISFIFPLSSAVAGGSNSASLAPAVAVSFAILHTNDFHGQLDSSLSASNPGSARIASVVNSVRTALGADKVLLVDAGDEMQGSLLSNLGDGTATGKGIPTIAAYNAMGYNVATFGNHEFDWGQVNLANRTTQATYPYVTANIVKNDTGNCTTAGWTKPDFADSPFEVLTVGSAPNAVKVGFIGVTTTETPTITVSTATAGLCFKDPADSIVHYYDAMKAAGADVIVVLSHLGFADGGYGYGIPVYGDQTLATKLNTAGKPVNLIIGGHSHSNLAAATVVGTTTIAQAYYNGRTVGRADVTVQPSGAVGIVWSRTTGFASGAKDPTIDALVTSYAINPAYLAIVNQPVGYSAVDLPRKDGGNSDNMMGTFIDDAIYHYLNTDGEPTNDVDIFFNNAGGIRADWCYVGGVWTGTGCGAGTHAPALLTYGHMYSVLPFGNATAVGQMTGAKILEVLNYGPNVAGVIQPAGLKYSYFKYADGTYVYAWGAYDVTVYNKATSAWEPLDLNKTYSVGTNEFLAPAGGDGYNAFKYMTNITYWGDMLNAVNAYVSANFGTPATAYAGPNGDGSLDGRIALNGDGDTVFDGGNEIVPLTILHHNDSHGNAAKGTYVGYTQLATLIRQERGRNPTRTLLLSSGDNIQGDAMMYYFKTAFSGFASDGTALAPALQMNPLIKAFNSMGYDAMTLGNHEFNFGSAIFQGELGQATFPLLQANVSEDPAHPYGLATANILPYVERTVGGDINVAILGIGNHRVPNYELPSNIPGLTFSDPIAKAQQLAALLGPTNDVVIALTHIGFTENPASVEVDANVDTNLVAHTSGLDAVIGGHSHTNPATGFAAYKYLPSIVVDPEGKPVLVAQAYRYNNTLGEISIGLRPLGGGNYEVVSQTGRYLSVSLTGTAEDPTTKAIVDPYAALLTTYNNTTIGQTTAPIDALQAFTQETNGANLQADAAVYELATVHSIPVDFHLSGAMTNSKIASSATPASPVTLKISDMFTAMPYENSLVVLSMNGPQLKAVLERAYRNYYYYKYVPGYGGYSYYTTCMLDTNSGNQITYNDLSPALPNGKNVVSLKIGGVDVDFTDATKFYKVSTVNYLAAGSCNFNDGGVTLWPLNQILKDTQYYVRDAVIDYITAMGTVSPAIEGRLAFLADSMPPVISAALGAPQFVSAPHTYITSATPLEVNINDPAEVLPYVSSGLASCNIDVVYPDASTHSESCSAGDNTLLFTGTDGAYAITVNAVDKAGNAAVPWVATYVLDNTPPALTKTIGDPNYVDNSTGVTFATSSTSIRVAADDAGGSGVAACTLVIDANPANPYIAGSDFTLPATDGPHTLSVVCVDNLANPTTLNEADTVDNTPPVLTVTSPEAKVYLHSEALTLAFSATDNAGSGIKMIEAALDGTSVTNGQVIDLLALSLGEHTLAVRAVDNLGQETSQSVTFSVTATIQSTISSVNRFLAEGKIDNAGIANSLSKKLENAQKSLDKGKKDAAINQLEAFIKEVEAQSGKHITVEAANLLIADARWVIDHMPS